ncbi:hypothetical protein KIW84_076502 [Lathyrus oleraceus]|uniref:F-box/kelch-repeat protein n=1 Tax=Pisum sativum TaxID=3888 RepID=A0A9D5A177_PEA|nr:hypothetical protein KIW84_076502 [Pisum sativum]
MSKNIEDRVEDPKKKEEQKNQEEGKMKISIFPSHSKGNNNGKRHVGETSDLGIIEHWVYFSCEVLKLEAFDPNHGRWMQLPKMICDECFMFSDKESLAIGTELLVFGKELMSPKIYKYSLLTNMWSVGKMLNTPRCLLSSASLGGIAILAGGCDMCGNILSFAELYTYDTGK